MEAQEWELEDDVSEEVASSLHNDEGDDDDDTDDKDGDDDEIQELEEAAPKGVHVQKISPGSARDLKPEAIVGVSKKHDNIVYRIKWRGVDEPELVSKKDAHQKWPLEL